MSINVSIIGKHSVVHLDKDFDYCNVPKIKKSINFLVEEKRKSIIFDFEKVVNFDSAAMGMLFNIFKQVRKYNGRLGLVNVNDETYELLRITTLDTILEIYNSIEDLK